MLRVRIDGGAAHHRAAARHRRDLHGLRPRHRRHHRPAEHPAALDPGRGRARDLAAARGRRPADHRGLRRHARASSSARPVAGIAADEIIDPTPAIEEITAPLHRRPGARQPAAQVQVRDHRAPQPRRRARDQRHLVRRRRAPRARPRLRPLGRRRPVDQPAAGRAARRLRRAGRGRRRLGRRRLDLPRLRLPPAAQQGPAEVPARRLGPGEVPRGARDRVPRARRCPTARRPRPPTDRGDHVGVHQQKDGRFYVGAAPVVGRVSGDAADRLADLAEAHGSDARAAHPAPEAVVLDVAPDRVDAARARPATSSASTAAPELVPPPHDGLHRHRVLQARDRRDQGHRDHAPSACSRSGSPTSSTRSTSRCRSTSTAAPTPAPASRSPTSASRASSSPTTTATRSTGFQVHLGGDRSAATRRLRPQGPRPQGHRRAGPGLRRARRAQLRRRDREPGERFATWATASRRGAAAYDDAPSP